MTLTRESPELPPHTLYKVPENAVPSITIAALFAVAGASRIRAEITKLCRADRFPYKMSADRLWMAVGTGKSSVGYAMTRVRAFFNIEEGRTPRRNLFEELYRPDSYNV